MATLRGMLGPFSKRSLISDETSMPSSTSTESSVISPLRQLLDAVNMSILPRGLRLSSITQACSFFDHRDRLTHDIELQEGAAFILYQKLAFALSINPTMTTDNTTTTAATTTEADHEIALLCSCLEMVHRASPDAIAATWYDIGQDILPLLVRVLERPYRRIMVPPGRSSSPQYDDTDTSRPVMNRHLKLAVQKVTKVLAIYSLVPEAKQPMVHCPGLLTVLVKIMDTRHLNRVLRINDKFNNGNHNHHNNRHHHMVIIMTEASRFNTIATLTNLAAAEENRIPMLAEPSLVDNIARIVQTEQSNVARQCSALALMNLSNGDVDHVPDMATEHLLETLVTLLYDELPETRRNAAVALFNVACADENTRNLARYRNGAILDAILELLCNDSDIPDETRSNAAETLFNMSCSDFEETTDRMANHSGLLEKLAMVLLKSTTTTSSGKIVSMSIDVQMYCAATLRRMAEIIQYPMMAQGPLLSALVKASAWVRTPDIAEAFEVHAECVENRLVMTEHYGLLNALCDMTVHSVKSSKQKQDSSMEREQVRMAAVNAIEKLSRCEEARPLLAHHSGIIMALTEATYDHQGGGTSVQENDDDDGEGNSSSMTIKGRMIQLALKNLIAAM